MTGTVSVNERSEVEIANLDDGLVRGTTIVPLHNPSGKADRQRHIAVSIVLRVRTDNAAAITRNFDRLMSTFVPLLKTQRVDSICGSDDLESLASWLIARFRNRGIGAARLERIELMDDGGPTYSVVPAADAPPQSTGDFVSLLQSFELVGQFTPGERYNTKRDAEAIREMIHSAGDAPIPMACFLCPPYVGESTPGGEVRYINVHDDFEDDPASYNFDYHYKLYIECARKVAELGELHGVSVQPIVVFSDWALIGIDDIRKTVDGDSEIVDRLNRFRDGMSRYCLDASPQVQVTSFRDLGVPDFFPLGLPMDAALRESWLADYARVSPDAGALQSLLAYAGNPELLKQLLDWRAFSSIGRSPHRGAIIDCLKVYHNICRLRFAALNQAEQERIGAIETEKAAELRRAAFVDAVLRFVQYQLYSRLFVEKFGPAICCYQDPGFTACGNLFRRSGFPVLFLDPNRVLGAS